MNIITEKNVKCDYRKLTSFPPIVWLRSSHASSAALDDSNVTNTNGRRSLVSLSSGVCTSSTCQFHFRIYTQLNTLASVSKIYAVTGLKVHYTHVLNFPNYRVKCSMTEISFFRLTVAQKLSVIMATKWLTDRRHLSPRTEAV